MLIVLFQYIDLKFVMYIGFTSRKVNYVEYWVRFGWVWKGNVVANVGLGVGIRLEWLLLS